MYWQAPASKVEKNKIPKKIAATRVPRKSHSSGGNSMAAKKSPNDAVAAGVFLAAASTAG
jgi:hypothetical protein